MPADLDNLARLAERCVPLGQLSSMSSAYTGYLVGGAVRDALLGRQLVDLDFAFSGDPTPLARDFARKINGHWFWLDSARRQSRVVAGADFPALVCDFAPLRAADIEGDLRARDFTVNAMALKLSDLASANLFDPTDGLSDLNHGCLRMTSEDALRDDPLRILKGVRHAAEMDFAIVPATLDAMRRQSPGLNRVALERVRQEVGRILAAEHVVFGLEQLSSSGAGTILFGQGFTTNLTTVSAVVDACRQAWLSLIDVDAVVGHWMNEELEQGLTSATLMTFVFLLRAIHPELTEEIVSRWPLSRRSRTNMLGLNALELSDVSDFMALPSTARAFALWSQQKGVEPKLLLPTLCKLAGSTSAKIDFCRWIKLVDPLDLSPPKDLVDGRWLREVLCLKDGPEMGRALELLRKAEMDGVVVDVTQARDFLVRQYQNKD